MSQRRDIAVALFAGLLCFGAALSVAASPQTSARYCLTGQAIGVAGYDPVAYFPEGGGSPQKGLFKFASMFDGVTYRFATQENLDRFKATPTKYLPQYGGWCSYGVANNMLFEPDPQNFVISDGKLYLFYRDPGMSTREPWLKDEQSLKTKAEKNWPGLRGETSPN